MHYKRNKRWVLALFVLVAAVIVSISILTPSGEKKSDTSKDIAVRTNSNLQFKSGGSNLLGNITENLTPRTKAQEKTGNLTEALIRSYIQSVAGNDGALPTTDEITSELQDNLSGDLEFTTFSIKDVITTDRNSQSDQIEYIESVGATLYENFKELEGENVITILQTFFENSDPTLINQFIKSIPLYIDDLLEINAPSLWADFHLQMLNVWQKKLVIYQAILDTESDPLKAYIALQELTDVLREDIDIQSILIQKYQEFTQ